jgi:hypothetical protein
LPAGAGAASVGAGMVTVAAGATTARAGSATAAVGATTAAADPLTAAAGSTPPPIPAVARVAVVAAAPGRRGAPSCVSAAAGLERAVCTIPGAVCAAVDATPPGPTPTESGPSCGFTCLRAAALIPLTNPANYTAARSNGPTPCGCSLSSCARVARFANTAPNSLRRSSTHGFPCERSSPTAF